MAATGRSYGWVRTLLLEADVVLRTRGGDHCRRCSHSLGGGPVSRPQEQR